MPRWEYKMITLRIAAEQGKMPGFFARGQSSRSFSEDSQQTLNALGAEGWELVSVMLLELGSLESGPSYASAVLKRPVAAPAP